MRLEQALQLVLKRQCVCAVILLLLSLPLASWGWGWPGAWGVLLGMGIGLIFLVSTWVVARFTLHLPVSQVSLLLLGVWVLKNVLLIGAVLLLRGAHFYHPKVFYSTLFVIVVFLLGIELFTLAKARILAVDTGNPDLGN